MYTIRFAEPIFTDRTLAAVAAGHGDVDLGLVTALADGTKAMLAGDAVIPDADGNEHKHEADDVVALADVARSGCYGKALFGTEAVTRYLSIRSVCFVPAMTGINIDLSFDGLSESCPAAMQIREDVLRAAKKLAEFPNEGQAALIAATRGQDGNRIRRTYECITRRLYKRLTDAFEDGGFNVNDVVTELSEEGLTTDPVSVLTGMCPALADLAPGAGNTLEVMFMRSFFVEDVPGWDSASPVVGVLIDRASKASPEAWAGIRRDIGMMASLQSPESSLRKLIRAAAVRSSGSTKRNEDGMIAETNGNIAGDLVKRLRDAGVRAAYLFADGRTLTCA